MSMFDSIYVKTTLEGKNYSHLEFQTKDFENIMDTYIITEDGKLLREQWHYEDVPEEQRPYFGKPEWDKAFGRIAGCMKKISEGWVDTNFHGWLNFYTSTPEGWLEFDVKFTDGYLSEVSKAYDH